jgi:hypothetical protein
MNAWDERSHVVLLAGLRTTLRHLFAVSLDTSEEFVPTTDGFFHARSAERASDATLPAWEVQDVGAPPRAVVAPEMVQAIFRIDSDRESTDSHMRSP